MGNCKLQITNHKQILPQSGIPYSGTNHNGRNSKPRFWLFGIWFLVIVCNLVLGAWNLSAQGIPPSSELITKAWEAHGKKDIGATFQYTNQVIDLYKEEADQQQAALKTLPKSKDEIQALSALNDVAVAYFIQGESYRDQGKNEEAINAFNVVVGKYCCAQAWDQRGWFWQIAKAADESIVKLKPGEPAGFGKCKCAPVEKTEEKPKVSQIPTTIVLYDPGKEDFVDYGKYGEFHNIGAKDYKYVIKDQEGLAQAVGEGIYPNTTSIRWDPEYKKVQKEGRLGGNHWDFVHSPDLEAAFLKWSTAPEPQGVKLFYTASILEKAGLIEHAIKCYYAIVVHFPSSYGWTYWKTPWYVGQAAIYRIDYLLRRNPKLGYKLADADIKIINGYDNTIANDIVVTSPGRFVKVGPLEKIRSKAPGRDLLSIKRRLGKGKVHLVQYETGDWELIVGKKPYVIKGVTYAPTKIGQSPDIQTLGNWMDEDFDVNGIIDAPYEAFVDRNGNNKKDKNEPAVGDFKLMRNMGVNTIRLYHNALPINKELLRELYEKYGIRVIMGDFLGKYAIGSGASWNPGTDYNNEEHKKNMLKTVMEMVNEYKDEPYILFWLLGNENVYGYACNADTDPDAFFKFANEVARQIKAIDPEHPVAICNGDQVFLDRFALNCPDIDIFGMNAYRGESGFGRIWRNVSEDVDKPVFVTEYGCPAYVEGKSAQEAEELQAEYHSGCWNDIENNLAFKGGAGNSIGGVAFEWVDEWWKQYEPSVHDTRGVAMGPFPDGYFHEEWFGICGQGDGSLSPFLRHLRKTYYMYQKAWR